MEIIKYLSGIMKAIEESSITVISLPTGIGKSLGIPAELAHNGYRVFVAEPTVPATISLAEKFRLDNRNIKTGYAADRDIKYTNKDLVVYMTHGHLKNLLLKSDQMDRNRSGTQGQNFAPILDADVIMLDEAHIGSIDVSLILSLYRYLNSEGIELPRLVISSATVDVTHLKAIEKMEKTVIKLEDISRFRIIVKYANKKILPWDQEYYKIMASIVSDEFFTYKHGHALVFMAGKYEINRLLEELKNIRKLDNIEILTAHSETPKEDLAKVLMDSKKRQIILCTNVFETSLTKNGTVFVFDSCLEKIPVQNDSGEISLETVYISKSSSVQRRGRTGRTNEGTYYVFLPEKDYNNLIPTRVEELIRLPLYREMLNLIGYGFQPLDVFPFISEKVKTELSSLQKQFILSMTNDKLENSDRSIMKVTEIGKFYLYLPLGYKNSTFLYRWIRLAYPEFPAICLAALLETYTTDFFILPSKKVDESDSDYRIRIDPIVSSIRNYFIKDFDITHVEVLEFYIAIIKKALEDLGTIYPKREDLETWCNKWFLSYKKMKEFFYILSTLIKSVSQFFKKEIKISNFTWKGLKEKSLPVLKEVFTEYSIISGRKYQNNLKKEAQLVDFKIFDSPIIPKNLIALTESEIKFSGRTINKIGLYLELEGGKILETDDPEKPLDIVIETKVDEISELNEELNEELARLLAD